MNTKEIAAKLNWAMQAVPLAKEQKDVLAVSYTHLTLPTNREV